MVFLPSASIVTACASEFSLSTRRQVKKSSVTYKGLGDGVTFFAEALVAVDPHEHE